MFTTVTGIIGAVHFLTASPYRPEIRVAEMPSLGIIKLDVDSKKSKEELKVEFHKKQVSRIAANRWLIESYANDLNNPENAMNPEFVKSARELIKLCQEELLSYNDYIENSPGIESEIQVELQKLKENK